MLKKTYKRQNRTRSNKINIKKSKRNIIKSKRNLKRNKRNKTNKTNKKRMRGGTTSSLISSFTTMPDSLYNICCAPAGQYRKNGVMLYKHNDTIVGKPLSPSSIKPRRDRSLSPPPKQ